MKNLYSKFIISLYQTKSKINGRSPLDIPKKLILGSFIAALCLGIGIGNIVFHSLRDSSMSQIMDPDSELFTYPKNANTAKARFKVLVPKIRLRQLSEIQVQRTRYILGATYDTDSIGNAIKFSDLQQHMNSLKNTGQNLQEELVGSFEYVLGVIPVLKQKPIDEMLVSYGIGIPIPGELKKLSDNDLLFFLTFNCLDHTRKLVSGGYHHPLRTLKALNGPIQWIIFILAIWGVLLLILRYSFTQIQYKLTHSGKLSLLSDENIWKIRETRLDNKALFIRLSESHPGVFLPVSLITDIYKAGVLSKTLTDFQSFVSDKIFEYRSKIENKEYATIDFIIYACPTLGFLGTIIGITQAFVEAAKIIGAPNDFLRSMAFESTTSALSVAFDTSAIGLLAVLILNYIISVTQKREANLLITLEQKALIELKRYWNEEKPKNISYV